jgi:hypothetical protein
LIVDMRPEADELLKRAVLDVVTQSIAFVHQLDAALREIERLHDQRAAELVEAVQMTLRQPPGPGTLRHLERTAAALLRSLQTE